MKTITEDELTSRQRHDMHANGLCHFIGIPQKDGSVKITTWLLPSEVDIQQHYAGHIYRVVESEPEPVQRDRSPSCPLCGAGIEAVKTVANVYRLSVREQEGNQAALEWEIYDQEPSDDAIEYRCVEGHDLDDGLRKRLGIPELN